jgi:hypothetical protein
VKYLSATDVVQRIKSCLSAEGVDVDGLFNRAGLGWFEQGTERAVDLLALSDQFSQLWEGLAAASGDPLIGFRVFAPDPLSWLGVLGHLMLASPTLKQAADNLMRYMPLVTPVVRATIEPKSDRVRVGLNLVRGVHPVPLQRYDFTWNLLLTTLRFVGARPELKPVLVEYAYPAPFDPALWAERFGCPVRFGAPANALEFANADITAPIPTANPLAAEGLFRLLDERLVQAERSSFAARVREMLPRCGCTAPRDQRTHPAAAPGRRRHRLLDPGRRSAAHHRPAIPWQRPHQREEPQLQARLLGPQRLPPRLPALVRQGARGVPAKEGRRAQCDHRRSWPCIVISPFRLTRPRLPLTAPSGSACTLIESKPVSVKRVYPGSVSAT